MSKLATYLGKEAKVLWTDRPFLMEALKYIYNNTHINGVAVDQTIPTTDQILAYNSTTHTIRWIDNSGGGTSIPAGEIAFGNGSGITSTSLLTTEIISGKRVYNFQTSPGVSGLYIAEPSVGSFLGTGDGSDMYVGVTRGNLSTGVYGINASYTTSPGGPVGMVLGDYGGTLNGTAIHINDTDQNITLWYNYGAGLGLKYDLSGLSSQVNRTLVNKDGTEVISEDVMLLDGTQAMTGTMDMGGFAISNVLDPTTGQQAATKNYVDTFLSGLSWKTAVRVAATTALAANTYDNAAGTLTGNSVGVLTVDGVAIVLNDRVLVTAEATQTHNGIYLCTRAGTGGVSYILTRSTDADAGAELVTATVATGTEGSSNANKTYTQTTPATITLGSSNLVFVKIFDGTYTEGTGIRIAGNVIYSKLSEGVTGGQTLKGGTAAEDTLTIQGSTSTDPRTTTAPAIILNSAGPLSASSGVQVHTRLDVTVNQSGTAGYTAHKINITASGSGTGSGNIVDYVVGGASKLSISDKGAITSAGGVKKRVLSLTSNSATPAINTNLYDVVRITSQSTNITSFTTSLSGTPDDSQLLMIQIKDNGTPVSLTWGASFESTTITLPTTTAASTLLRIGLQWNTLTSKWSCIAVV